jgi:hypothetical protein
MRQYEAAECVQAMASFKAPAGPALFRAQGDLTGLGTGGKFRKNPLE